MKYKIYILFTILILNSCSISEFTVNKRLYNKGFYVDFNNKNDKEIIRDTVVKINKTDKIAKISQIEKSLLLSASTEKDVKSILIENEEIKKEFLEISNIAKSDTTKQDSIKSKAIIAKKFKTLSFVSIVIDIMSDFLLINGFILGNLAVIYPFNLFIIYFIGVLLILSTLLAFKIVKRHKNNEDNNYKWIAQVAKYVGLASSIFWFIQAFVLTILLIVLG